MTSEVECDIHCTIKKKTLKISRGATAPLAPAMYGLVTQVPSGYYDAANNRNRVKMCLFPSTGAAYTVSSFL